MCSNIAQDLSKALCAVMPPKAFFFAPIFEGLVFRTLPAGAVAAKTQVSITCDFHTAASCYVSA
jgi:hypothetical protein